MSKNIIVTGANGFIGSHIVSYLSKVGMNPILLVRKNSNLSRISYKNRSRLVRTNNILDNETISKLKSLKPSSLIHCAWNGVLSKDRNKRIQFNNLKFSINTVELASRLNCKDWTGLGSHAEYGMINKKINERSKCSPTTLYGKTKLKTGNKCLSLCKNLSINGKWVRIFDTYGPNDNESWLIPYLIKCFLNEKTPHLTSCEQIWDFLHIYDAVKAIILLHNSEKIGIYNLGSNKPRPLKEYVSIIRKNFKKNINPKFGIKSYRPDQVEYLYPDISKITSELKWKPIISFNEGIKRLINKKQYEKLPI